MAAGDVRCNLYRPGSLVATGYGASNGHQYQAPVRCSLYGTPSILYSLSFYSSHSTELITSPVWRSMPLDSNARYVFAQSSAAALSPSLISSCSDCGRQFWVQCSACLVRARWTLASITRRTVSNVLLLWRMALWAACVYYWILTIK